MERSQSKDYKRAIFDKKYEEYKKYKKQNNDKTKQNLDKKKVGISVVW